MHCDDPHSEHYHWRDRTMSASVEMTLVKGVPSTGVRGPTRHRPASRRLGEARRAQARPDEDPF